MLTDEIKKRIKEVLTSAGATNVYIDEIIEVHSYVDEEHHKDPIYDAETKLAKEFPDLQFNFHCHTNIK